jgi:hypothetical protein
MQLNTGSRKSMAKARLFGEVLEVIDTSSLED